MQTKSEKLSATFAGNTQFDINPRIRGERNKPDVLLETLVLRRLVPPLPDCWQSRGITCSALND